VVEYKSLWHALLTLHRPRRALEELNQILDADCKYAAVKEQVLSHAQNSEAVKTSKALRALIYIAMICVIVAVGIVGWFYWQHRLLLNLGSEATARFEADLPKREDAIEHVQLREDIGELRKKYASVPELEAKINGLDAKVQSDFERRADLRLSLSESLRAAGKFSESYAVLNDLKIHYPGTRAASGAEVARTRIRTEEIGTEIAQPAQQRRHAGHRRPARDDREDTEAGLDHGDRSVLEVGGRVRIRGYSGHLLELARPLPGRRVVVTAPQDGTSRESAPRQGDVLHHAIETEYRLDGRRQPVHGGRFARGAFDADAGHAQRVGQEGHDGEFRDVRLGRGHGKLRTRLERHDDIRRVRERRRRIVGDGEGQRALGSTVLDDPDHVG
jgi:hypothetical protein